MNNQFDGLAKNLAHSVRWHCGLKQFGVGLAGLALAAFLTTTSAVAAPPAGTTTLFDPAGDAVFPFDLYHASVPPYLDMVQVSVSPKRGVFRFEVQVNAEIPANADPGFTPSVNHLGVTVGILTGRKAAGSPFKFFGQTDTYHFNYLVGALYSAADSGAGLGLGWRGFLIDASTFSVIEIPLEIRGQTFVFETTAASLGNPSAFDWAVVSECDPVTIFDEKRKSVLMADFAPDHGYSHWPAP